MKKIILTAFVIFACVVNAADNAVPWPVDANGKEYHKQPWDRSPLGMDTDDPYTQNINTVYRYQRDDVIFDAQWGKDSSNNKLISYERVDSEGNNITGWKYYDGTFTFTSDYVWTNFATRTDKEGTLGKITEFGYYLIDDNGKALTPQVISTEEGDTKIKNSVIFKRDETIGFYVEIGGKTYTTTPNAIEGATAFVNNVDTDSRGKEDQYFCLFQDKIDGQKHYEYLLAGSISIKEDQSYDDFLEEVIEQNNGGTTITHSTGGQPLPGLLMTLAIGGTAVAGMKKRNKKA